MKWFSLRRLLLIGLVLGILGVGAVIWLLGTGFGRRQLEQRVREQVARHSDLVLAPFDVDFSLWRDFPYLTASLRHLSLTDTAYRHAEPVFSVGRADLRLALSDLVHGRVRVTRLTVIDVAYQERVDSRGRHWGLRGKHPHRTGPGRAPALQLTFDSLLIRNFHLTTRNEYTRTASSVSVRQARLTVGLQQGVLRAGGTLDGQLDYLRKSSVTLFRHEPVRAWVNYRYAFGPRQGTFWHTRGTLNGDTIRVSGTHTTPTDQPVGTMMNLQFEGTQPLMDVLRTALPPSLQSYLAGAVSASKTHIRYTITGLNAPTVTTHNVLRFGLRGARLVWPDSTRRINHWDLQGTLDNGPGHTPRTTILTLSRCRIYSSAGQLNIGLVLRDFTRPILAARLRGRTELPALAAVVSPRLWRARRGIAELDLRVHGALPLPPGRRPPGYLPPRSLAVGGVMTLRQAAFVLLDRGAAVSELNARVQVQDSLWRLSRASGVLDGMRFQASATTVSLLAYLTGRAPTTSISGQFAVDELRVLRLRELIRPIPASTRPTAATAQRRARMAKRAVGRGSSLFPPGLHLDVGLRCQRLVLATDTLHQLAATVRHDGRRVQLLNLAGRVWGGQVRGQASWPTGTDRRLGPVTYQLGVHFDSINYRHLLGRISRPPRHSAKAPASPALRELLLAANGQLTCDIDAVRLPASEQLRHLRVHFAKNGGELQMPYLHFDTTLGGTGDAVASAQVAGTHVLSAEASLNLRYATLDVQHLLQLLASLTPTYGSPPDSLTRASNRTARRARRSQKPDAVALTNGLLTAVLRVQADQVRYVALTGTHFRLVSHLEDEEARLDDCSFDAFQGKIRLRGQMLTNEGREHHPVHVQAQLEDIQLPELFAATGAMGLKLLSGNNIRGSMRCAADLRTDLDATFLPDFSQTLGYLQTDLRDLELLNVEALAQALKFLKTERTNHLFFEPVSTQFVLDRGQLLIPDLRLNSNLADLHITGTYGLDGGANLYVGLNPLQALLSKNTKRVRRIQNGKSIRRPDRPLTYVNVRRPAAGSRYQVRLFQKTQQRQQQAILRQQCQQVLTGQQLDTTLQLLR